jgi:tetratricopeptide (TPR) repeat protein
LCETGVIGGVAYLAMWAAFVLTVVRAARSGSLSWLQSAALLGAGVGYFAYSLFAPDGIATDLSIVVTFAVAGASTPALEEKGAFLPINPRRLVRLGLVFLCALGALWFGSLSPFLSSYFVKEAIDGMPRNSGTVTVALLERAQRFSTPYIDDQFAAVVGIAAGSVQSETAPTRPQQATLISMALEMSEKYLHINPSHARQRIHLADALVSIGRASGRPEIVRHAESLYQQSIAESPKRQLYRLAYGNFLTQSRRLDEAEEQFRKALADAPDMGEPMWSLGRFLWSERKQDEEGSRLMVQSTDESAGDFRYLPPSPLEWLQLAEALKRQLNRDRMRAMVSSLRLLPKDSLAAKACLRIARVMEDVGLTQERDQLLKLGIERDPLLANAVAPVLSGNARLSSVTTP